MELHPLVKVVIGVLGIGVFTVAIWLGSNSGDMPVQSHVVDESPLPIPPTGPYSKVVVEETIHRFPPMTVGAKGKHVFIFQNTGEAPLMLKQGKSTCKCTISNVGDGEIPPGGEAHVELAWDAKAVSPDFRQVARIITNDPEMRFVELILIGSIYMSIDVRPKGGWALSKMNEDEPTTVSGYVTSSIHDAFDLQSPIQSSSEALTAEAVPLTPEECRQLSIKCGYRIDATLKPELPIGPFREYLTIHTNLPDVSPVDIFITGTRTGPISILATGNTRWNSKAMIVNLGEFDAALGAKATLLMFVAGLDETDFEFVSVEKDPETIQVTLQPDPNFQSETRQKLLLTFEVPPGDPARARGIDRLARVTIKTNHPGAHELMFRIQFISR